MLVKRILRKHGYPPDMAEEATKTGVSFIPLVGPFLGPGLSFVEAVHDAQAQRHAWYAALMRLRSMVP